MSYGGKMPCNLSEQYLFAESERTGKDVFQLLDEAREKLIQQPDFIDLIQNNLQRKETKQGTN